MAETAVTRSLGIDFCSGNSTEALRALYTIKRFVDWEYQTYGSMELLAEEIVPTLTGLNLQELEKLGYALIEDDSERTLVFVRPSDLIEA